MAAFNASRVVPAAPSDSAGVIRLLEETAGLEKKRALDYPQFELSNEEIVAGRKAAGKKLLATSEAFRSSKGEIAGAWRAVQARLLKSDPVLALALKVWIVPRE